MHFGQANVPGSRRMEESGTGKGSFFACYLLTSLNPRYKGCHYIGFTVNPRRRIRQHNGELTSGAWRTHRKRPWDMVLCVYGFSSQVEALQFEWAWQHPIKSLAVKEAAARIPSSVRGLKKQFYLLFTMLNCDKWSSMDLNVQFLSSKYIGYRKGCPGLPPHMGLSIATVDSLPMNPEEADSELDLDVEKEGSREITSGVGEFRDSVQGAEPNFSDVEEDNSDLSIDYQNCRRGEIERPKSLDWTGMQRKPPDVRVIGDAVARSSYATSVTQSLVNAIDLSGRQATLGDERQPTDFPGSVDYHLRKAPVDDDDLVSIRYRQLPASLLSLSAEAPVQVSLLETSPRFPKNAAVQNAQGLSKSTSEASESKDLEGQSSGFDSDWHEKIPPRQILSPLPNAVGSEMSPDSPFSAFLERYAVPEPSSIVKRCLQQKSKADVPILSDSSASVRNPSNEGLAENLPCTTPCKPRVVVVIPDDTPIMSSREVIDLTDSPYCV